LFSGDFGGRLGRRRFGRLDFTVPPALDRDAVECRQRRGIDGHLDQGHAHQVQPVAVGLQRVILAELESLAVFPVVRSR
jgi:hypothetical protein